MIKPYIGDGWCLDENGDRMPCNFTKEDGMVQAFCDVCGEELCDEDKEGSNIFCDEDDVKEVAQDYDWETIGRHHICRGCIEGIERGDIDITIKLKKGAKDGK